METTLGKRIAALRRDKGLKQDELAQQLGVTPQAVSKWENDQTCPGHHPAAKAGKNSGGERG